MQNRILTSVIEITKQQDIDSLEYSLLATLAELIPAEEICLHKFYYENEMYGVEEIIQLNITNDESGNKQFTWNRESEFDSVDPKLEQCIQEKKPVLCNNTVEKQSYITPINFDGKKPATLSVISSGEITCYYELIQGLISVYTNYLIILNESERDKLTNLFNRRTFDKKLNRLLQYQRNNIEQYLKVPISNEQRKPSTDSCAWLVIMDIDHFKRVNDNYGHVYGDEVLLSFSQNMRQNFRKSDLLFRFGGEEFVVVLEPISFEMAMRKLENFRNVIANHEFSQVGKLTVSIGFAKITELDYPPSVLECADRALYYSKEHGRNCTHNYENLVDVGAVETQKVGGAVDLF